MLVNVLRSVHWMRMVFLSVYNFYIFFELSVAHTRLHTGVLSRLEEWCVQVE